MGTPRDRRASFPPDPKRVPGERRSSLDANKTAVPRSPAPIPTGTVSNALLNVNLPVMSAQSQSNSSFGAASQQATAYTFKTTMHSDQRIVEDEATLVGSKQTSGVAVATTSPAAPAGYEADIPNASGTQPWTPSLYVGSALGHGHANRSPYSLPRPPHGVTASSYAAEVRSNFGQPLQIQTTSQGSTSLVALEPDQQLAATHAKLSTRDESLSRALPADSKPEFHQEPFAIAMGNPPSAEDQQRPLPESGAAATPSSTKRKRRSPSSLSEADGDKKQKLDEAGKAKTTRAKKHQGMKFGPNWYTMRGIEGYANSTLSNRIGGPQMMDFLEEQNIDVDDLPDKSNSALIAALRPLHRALLRDREAGASIGPLCTPTKRHYVHVDPVASDENEDQMENETKDEVKPAENSEEWNIATPASPKGKLLLDPPPATPARKQTASPNFGAESTRNLEGDVYLGPVMVPSAQTQPSLGMILPSATQNYEASPPVFASISQVNLASNTPVRKHLPGKGLSTVSPDRGAERSVVGLTSVPRGSNTTGQQTGVPAIQETIFEQHATGGPPSGFTALGLSIPQIYEQLQAMKRRAELELDHPGQQVPAALLANIHHELSSRVYGMVRESVMAQRNFQARRIELTIQLERAIEWEDASNSTRALQLLHALFSL